MVPAAKCEQRRQEGGDGGGGGALQLPLMRVHDESLLPDPHLFLDPGYTGTIANHLALSLSRAVRLN